MTGESLAIIVVILVMSFMFLRAKKRVFALLVLPLICVPAGYLLGMLLFRTVSLGMGFSAFTILFVLLGLLLDEAICALLSRSIPTKRGKNAYLGFISLFSVLLTLAYILRLT